MELVALDGVTATRAEHAARLQVNVDTVGAYLRQGLTERPGRIIQKCGACGQPRRGHVCANKSPTTP